MNMKFWKKQINDACFQDPLDLRDKKYEDVALGAAPVDWNKGYDIEKELNFTLPIKNQGQSLSCTGQGGSYYFGILNLVELKEYIEVSAKSLYSQIFLPNGGAYIRDIFKLCVDWGAVYESLVSSYKNGKLPTEDFMRELSWKNEEIDKIAKVLQAKEYRVIEARDNMDLFAMAIRDNYGVVGGVHVGNNGSWRTNEPTPSDRINGHCIYYGKFGIDEKGKYIATPNSWGERKKDELHLDGWQKLRQDYFNKLYQFNPWVMVDKPNITEATNDPEVQNILVKNEKKFIIEGAGVGRKGVLVNGKLLELTKEREPSASIYVQTNNGSGLTISTELYNKLPKGGLF